MRNTLVAAAVTAALAMGSMEASAAPANSTQAEIEAMKAQLQALSDRLNKVESANTQLQSENEQLKAAAEQRDAEVDYLKAQTKDLRQETAQADASLGKLNGADWASRIKFKGDFRLREEYIQNQYVAGKAPTTTTPSTLSVEEGAEQWRTRFRFRVGATAQVTDHSTVTFRLDSGDGDPRSTNQTYTNESSEKGIYIGQAYADWNFLQGADLLLGKQPYPFWRPAYSLFWDGDVNPEAVAATYNSGMFFGSGWAWTVLTNANNNSSYVNVDPTIFGLQAGLKFPLLGGETKVAALYYNLANGQGNAPFYNGNTYGNTTYARFLNGSTTATQVLKYNYEIVELSAEMGTTLFNLPFTFWADWSQNVAADVEYDNAWSVGAGIGKAANYHTWEASVMYESMDKDAMFAQFIDSDFAGGVTDADGWVFKAAYAPVKNVTVNATYFLNTTNKDVYAVSGNVASGPYAGPYAVGKDMSYDRFQLDVNYKF
ncbi:MAG: putative porin [Steroidobacteraceae bacterium]